MTIRPRRLIDYAEIIWRRKRLIFLMSLAMLIATYVIIRRVPKIYESHALILIANDQSAGEEGAAYAEPFAAVMQHMTSRGNLAQLIRRYNLYPQIKDLEMAIGTLQQSIKTDVKMRGYYPDGAESVTISYRYPDKQLARGVVADLVSHFERANVDLRQKASAELQNLNGKLAEVEGKLRELGPQRDLDAIRSQAAASRASETTALRSQRYSVESTIESLSSKEYALDLQVNDLKRQIAEQEKLVAAANSKGPALNNAAYGALLVRESELEAQLKLYLTQYTDKNPKVIATREQLNGISRQIERMANAGPGGAGVAATSPEHIELRRMKQDLNRLGIELETTRRDLKRKTQTLDTIPYTGSQPSVAGIVGQGEGSSSRVRTEYDRMVVRYTWLLDKQDKLLKLSGASGKSGQMFEIVDPASTPNLPVAPRKMILYGLALALSLVFGLFVVALVELPRLFVVSDERDVEYYLGTQVLALIPETRTPIEVSRSRKLRLTRAVALLVLTALTAQALILVLDRVKVFQILGSR